MSLFSRPRALALSGALAAAALALTLVPSARATTLSLFPFPFPFPPFTGILGPWWIFGHPSNPYKTVPQPVAFACFGGGGNCECPSDNNHDSGTLINVWPGFQCAYPSGACTWEDVTGVLQNPQQTNCPSSATCSASAGCSCPSDNNGDTGSLINQFTGYQCAYPHGACTWDFDGDLQNTQQTNCPATAPCKQSGKDSRRAILGI